MRGWHGEPEHRQATPESIPFPADPGEAAEHLGCLRPRFDLTGLPDSAGQVLDAIEHMSRRIEDLARELNCLGYFSDGDDDGPRAA